MVDDVAILILVLHVRAMSPCYFHFDAKCIVRDRRSMRQVCYKLARRHRVSYSQVFISADVVRPTLTCYPSVSLLACPKHQQRVLEHALAHVRGSRRGLPSWSGLCRCSMCCDSAIREVERAFNTRKKRQFRCRRSCFGMDWPASEPGGLGWSRRRRWTAI